MEKECFCGNSCTLFCWCLWNLAGMCNLWDSLWNSCAGASAISVQTHDDSQVHLCSEHTRLRTYIQNYCFDAKSCKIFWCERGGKGKCDFHVKTRWIPASNQTQEEKNTQRDYTIDSRKRNKRWKLHLQFRGIIYEKFHFNISCILVLCLAARSIFPFPYCTAAKHQHPLTGGKGREKVLLMPLLWMIIVTKYFALETFFDSIVQPLTLSLHLTRFHPAHVPENFGKSLSKKMFHVQWKWLDMILFLQISRIVNGKKHVGLTTRERFLW